MSLYKAKYYLKHVLIDLLPAALIRLFTDTQLKNHHPKSSSDVYQRVDYYNKLNSVSHLHHDFVRVNQFKKDGGNTYYFDLLKVIKGFNPTLKFSYLNGDIRHVPEQPTFVKSRPIGSDNHNSILLKLNAIRHFTFINDSLSYREKKDMAVWRGIGIQLHRKVVIEQFYNHDMCNIGQTKPKLSEPWVKDYLSIDEQLTYKFILAIEGNDVATNLKWAMSSNSLVIMSKPKYETWFMEGRLQKGVHYVEVKDDYSDLIEKMEYYIAHPEEAESIIKNAHIWVDQFRDKKRERLISLLVAKKYFDKSGQM
ncbi:glycosyl transferase family 90 [Vibrio sp. OPT18]|uniref:glycosyl transferase family 90 n=1 Tax=Vibrio sp. OPT18 TaxID=2778641 RepID=UPI001880FB33|nr:glycosyl transferase family 90 [Vibrio sp. OPT18]MBE8578950.1 lipopolysaccharide A protein [Vibrio sp. OPT18]